MPTAVGTTGPLEKYFKGDNLTGRQTNKKATLEEDDLSGRQPNMKTTAPDKDHLKGG